MEAYPPLKKGVFRLLQKWVNGPSEYFSGFFWKKSSFLKINFFNFLKENQFYICSSFSRILTIAKVSNSQYSNSCLLVFCASPSKVSLTIERKVLDAVPPSFMSRSLYESSGTSEGRTYFME